MTFPAADEAFNRRFAQELTDRLSCESINAFLGNDRTEIGSVCRVAAGIPE